MRKGKSARRLPFCFLLDILGEFLRVSRNVVKAAGDPYRCACSYGQKRIFLHQEAGDLLLLRCMGFSTGASSWVVDLPPYKLDLFEFGKSCIITTKS